MNADNIPTDAAVRIARGKELLGSLNPHQVMDVLKLFDTPDCILTGVSVIESSTPDDGVCSYNWILAYTFEEPTEPMKKALDKAAIAMGAVIELFAVFQTFDPLSLDDEK